MLYKLKHEKGLVHFCKLFLQTIFIVLAITCGGAVDVDDDDDDEDVDFEDATINKDPSPTKENPTPTKTDNDPKNALQSSNSLDDVYDGIQKSILAALPNMMTNKIILGIPSSKSLSLLLNPANLKIPSQNVKRFIIGILDCFTNASIAILPFIEDPDKYIETHGEGIKNFFKAILNKNVLESSGSAALIGIAANKEQLLPILDGEGGKEAASDLFKALFVKVLEVLQKNASSIKNYTSGILDPQNEPEVKKIIGDGNRNILSKIDSKNLNKNIDKHENVKNIVPQVQNQEGLYKSISDSMCGLIAILLFPHITGNKYSAEDSKKSSLTEEQVTDVMNKYVKHRPEIKDLKDKIKYLFDISEQDKSYTLLEAVTWATVNNFIFPFIGLLPKALVKFGEDNLEYKNLKVHTFKDKKEIEEYLAKLKEGDKIIPLGIHDTAMHYYNASKQSDGKFNVVDSNFYNTPTPIDSKAIVDFTDLSINKVSSCLKHFLVQNILGKKGGEKVTKTDEKELERLFKAFYGDKFKNLDATSNKIATIIRAMIADDLGEQYKLDSTLKLSFNYALITQE